MGCDLSAESTNKVINPELRPPIIIKVNETIL
jgi:hypothetical protein